MPKISVQVLRVGGEVEKIAVSRDSAFQEIAKAIAAQTLDGVNLRDGRVMFVDDDGYRTEFVDHGAGRFELKCVEARKPVNREATKLYRAICVPGTTHEIVGDVAIVLDADFG